MKSNVATYTCPMHPEVRQDSPGTCPKCGMQLVPAKRSHGNGITLPRGQMRYTK